MHRFVKNVSWADRCGRPAGIPYSRPKGVKAAGVLYEKAVAKALDSVAKHGQWWAFRDANGPGHCQTDILIETPSWIAVVECKLTWREQAESQLNHLYLPVVRMATGKPVIGVVICKNLTRYSPTPHGDLQTALKAGLRGGVLGLVHWIGAGPLVPGLR